MSAFKWILALLAIAIVLTSIFHISILQSRPLLLFFGGALVILLIISLLEIVGKVIGIIVSIAAFLFLLYILMLGFKLLV